MRVHAMYESGELQALFETYAGREVSFNLVRSNAPACGR